MLVEECNKNYAHMDVAEIIDVLPQALRSVTALGLISKL
jgi:hypothetical protein